MVCDWMMRNDLGGSVENSRDGLQGPRNQAYPMYAAVSKDQFCISAKSRLAKLPRVEAVP